MDWNLIKFVGFCLLVALVVLWGMNKFLIYMFNIVSSFVVSASIFVVIYPPYTLTVPKLIDLKLGRFFLWEPPSAQIISDHLPKEFDTILPKIISDQNISLFVQVDHMELISNLLSIFLIYVVILTIYLTHKNKT